uniref:ATP synthase F0 subunit 8 n=1 Tax=Pristolycus diversecostatus TaxID=2985487 RepID=UPI0022384388|nr:ATP synthase F0 subunit 8 [Pristolycus diversecostatus]UYE92360.1 ATP synthase F0 subunit 8 [Pristolycus diversecostatus]
MPQMAPLSWLNLFMFFIMVFMMFNMMNYFSLMYKNKSLNQQKTKKTFLWKW